MANYATTKAALDAAIRTNGVQAITGAVLNTILNDILAALGKHYQFGGLVTPDAAFTAGDEKVAFFAVEAGTYTNFGGVTLDGKTLHILTYDSAWHDADTSIPSGAAFEAALALAIKGSQSGIAEGIADTISAGTAQEFLQRQSGGDGVNCIKRIKGKTIAWNQLIASTFSLGTGDDEWGTFDSFTALSISDNVLTLTKSGRTGIAQYKKDGIILSGHKYLLSVWIKTTAPAGSVTVAAYAVDTLIDGVASSVASSDWQRLVVMKGCQSAEPNSQYFRIRNGENSDFHAVEIKQPEFIDLTLMFGAGNEPSTIAEFEALYPALYYAYNAGVLKSNDAAALLTDGRNQWDEEWEQGSIDASGQNISSSIQIRSKNYVPVFPSTQFYFYSGSAVLGRVCYYDANKNFVSVAYPTENTIITTPAGAYFMRFVMGNGSPAITTYANDICINLSDPAFNGTYEPYWQRVLALRLSELTGIPEGGTEADRVTMFPNGAGGAGSAFDSIFVENGVTKARKTMLAEVDLGDLAWVATSEGGGADGYVADVSGMKTMASTAQNLICSRFVTNYSNTKGSIYTTDNKVVVPKVNDTYADAAAFKTAMVGVKLLAEAATPIVYTDLQYADGTPFTMPATILVDNYGTERIQAPEGATTPSAPFCCDSNYSIGVANLVKRLAALENAE